MGKLQLLKDNIHSVEVIIFVQLIIPFEGSIPYLYHYPITSLRSDSMLPGARVLESVIQATGKGSAECVSEC